jgi:hypothetical protein
MSLASILRQQIAGHHDILEQTIADCDQAALDRVFPGATITSIGSIYAHTVFGEDALVQGMLQGKPPVHQTQGWGPKLGVPMPQSPMLDRTWAAAVRMDLGPFREYARAVYAATEAYVGSLSDGDLARKLDTGFVGEQTVAWFLGNVVAWHVAEHNGEIAALKGLQGLKGLPF